MLSTFEECFGELGGVDSVFGISDSDWDLAIIGLYTNLLNVKFFSVQIALR